MTDDCVFCRVVSGEFEASVVVEDGYAVALMDKGPIQASHVLVIPRRHTAQLSNLSDDEAADIFDSPIGGVCASEERREMRDIVSAGQLNPAVSLLFPVFQIAKLKGDFPYGRHNYDGTKNLADWIFWLACLAVHANASSRSRN